MKLENSTIDPRTLEPLRELADCHLIPKFLNASNVTVRLNKMIDNQLGFICDAELQKYLSTMLGVQIDGVLSLKGGSNRLQGRLDIKRGIVVVPKPKRGSVSDWADRALGFQNGNVEFESFYGMVVDSSAAFLSMIHSAFLVLHWHRRPEIFETRFDCIRNFFRKAVEGTLDQKDHEVLREMVGIQFSLPKEGLGDEPLTDNNLRSKYDPNFDCGDGLFDSFPQQCVRMDQSGQFIVTLPYSRNLRTTVTFS